ncbi:MAG: AmmeMemoRadiSam system radical SAM enzyme [Saprospiraceae bacterium]|nr:AmmeMemoRadiSam system radical SAM enzyme [Saprospiraceae bacterium]
MKEAEYYSELGNGKVKCELCPHFCIISDGKYGNCNVRKNVDGKLIFENYGKLSSLNFDPIEKKPLYHFYPGRKILSIGSLGCNIHCKFCQNSEISQATAEDYPFLRYYPIEQIIELAKNANNNCGIAYTYNEPTVWFEFMIDIAIKATENNLRNVMVTNGFINAEPLEVLTDVIHAFNVDLKAFTEDFYKSLTKSSLEPVKQSLKQIRKSGRHLEITNLLITNHNDNEYQFYEMLKWIEGELGEETVLHISKYHPYYKLKAKATSEKKLIDFYNIAKEYLKHVYIGNINTKVGQNTYCPNCNELLIQRNGYETIMTNLNFDSSCGKCNHKVLIYL